MPMRTDTLRVTGAFNHANDFQPDIDPGQLAQRSTQEYGIDLANPVAHQQTANAAGIGITGTADNFVTSVEKVGAIIKTTILIDVDGLNSGGTPDDVIGADGAGVAHLGQITAAVNGTIFAGKVTCLQTPTVGEPDIDLWYTDDATGVEDTLISAMANQVQSTNHGDWTAGQVAVLTAFPPANKYLYLGGGAATDATYTAGILLIELWGTDTTGDLAIIRGALGTNAPSLQTEDLQKVGVTWRYRRYEVILPPEYVIGQTVKIRLIGGMITTVADTTAFVDVECYENEEDNSVSADLCTTLETTINALIASPTTVDFTITSSTLSPGTVLDVRVGVEVTDAATAAEVIGCITKVSLLCDTKG
ncbi:hypothetical protein LCGC14_0336470 [marine sediment metagenome]|uniref:Uncharacterized protein n=1 Tax=marine sediment metagenome TaxID=412755 RepID=A0A0F9TXY1_9ZZZZ